MTLQSHKGVCGILLSLESHFLTRDVGIRLTRPWKCGLHDLHSSVQSPPTNLLGGVSWRWWFQGGVYLPRRTGEGRKPVVWDPDSQVKGKFIVKEVEGLIGDVTDTWPKQFKDLSLRVNQCCDVQCLDARRPSCDEYVNDSGWYILPRSEPFFYHRNVSLCGHEIDNGKTLYGRVRLGA